MSNTDNQQQVRVGPEIGKGYALSGKIMLSAIVVLFAVVVFLVGLHLYARWYVVRLRRRQLERRRGQRRVNRSQIVMYIDSRLPGGNAGVDRGLDREVLNSLPVFLHSPKPDQSPALLECAVCISEFEEKEIVRLLPKCGHSFHIECIDMWFRSHSTCPLCRSPVEQVFHQLPEPASKQIEPDDKSDMIEPSSSSGSLPGRSGDGGAAPLGWRRKGLELERVGVMTEVPMRRVESENDSTQNSPAGRLLSFKRILSMGRWSPATTSSGPSGTSELDLESGSSESNRVRTPR